MSKPPEKRPSKSRRTSLPPIKVYVFPEELEKISKQANAVGLPLSAYLRAIGTETRLPPSGLPAEQAKQIASLASDLNRIGGLLKAMLTNSERYEGRRGKTLQENTLDQIEELAVTNRVLKDLAQKLLRTNDSSQTQNEY